MAIYAISDLHLSFHADKPMNIFGWENYEEKIKQDWKQKVKEDDLVLVPGDFSWSMHLEDTYEDFYYLNELPGKKLLLKGNHDYWWNTLTKMRAYLQEKKLKNIDFIYNNAYEYKDYIIVGTRGWNLGEETIEDKKILNREVERLKLSIQKGIKQFGQEKKMIVCMHYPPKKEKLDSPFVKVIEEYNVEKCIYGHLHGNNHKAIVERMINGIEYIMVSCDHTDFKLIPLTEK